MRLTESHSDCLVLDDAHIIEINGESVSSIPCRIVQNMNPHHVVIEVHELPLLRSMYGSDGRGFRHTWQIRLDSDLKLEVFRTSLRTVRYSPSFSSVGQNSLIPAKQPLTAIDKHTPIHELYFHTLNLREIENIYGRNVQIELSDCDIVLQPVGDLEKLASHLENVGSIGVTYEGKIMFRSEQGATSEEAASLVRALEYFLSFGTGLFCGLANVYGVDAKGDKSWVQWGVRHIDRWPMVHDIRHSLLNHVHCRNGLTDALPRFLELWKSIQWRRTVSHVIGLYLMCGSLPPHISITTAWTALECVGNYMEERRKEGGGEASKNILDKVKYAFADLSLDNADLRQVYKIVAGIKHGRLSVFENTDYFDQNVVALAQLELALLALIEYSGKYCNRMTRLNDEDSQYPTFRC